MEALFEKNIPVCATEVFAIDQMLSVCQTISESWQTRTGKRPPFYASPHSGIFDEYLSAAGSTQWNPTSHRRL